MPAVAVILGSAFTLPPELPLAPVLVDTPFGLHTLFRIDLPDREAWVSFRHGLPHARLPHQVNYRAQAAALARVGCKALLVTSSARVLDPELPLYTPIAVDDLLMLDNRLPDGTACTMFPQRTHDQGHLVYDEGPFSCDLDAQLREIGVRCGSPVAGRAVFGWQIGPRAATRAERRMWVRLGAQVTSMTLAPEVVLANELGIPCVAVVTGRRRCNPEDGTVSPGGEHDGEQHRGRRADDDTDEHETECLRRSREGMEGLIEGFLRHAEPVAAGNRLYRFEGRGSSGEPAASRSHRSDERNGR